MSKAAHGAYAASITPIDPASGQPSGERLIEHCQWLLDDARVQDVVHTPGETKHFKFAKGESFTHSVQNIGDTDLIFTTVEFIKDSPNDPLDIPDSIRLQGETQ